jgi:outer membrane receptor protein involved in Fe transport
MKSRAFLSSRACAERLPVKRTALASLIGLAFAAPQAWAQAANTENDPRFGAQTITVTATKRSQTIQEVSASVTAIDEKSMEIAGIVDPTRLGLVVPGLRVGYSGDEARFAIRGARTNNVGVTAQQVVGVFNDGAYAATTGQTLASYLDVQRIEVLRGPQGTLYGRNTFAGAINVISNQPEFGDTYGNVNAVLGDYRRVRAQSVLNLPLSNTLAVRVALMGDRHDGYIRNSYLEGTSDDLRNENVQVGRVTLRWKPTKDFDASLRITSYDRDTNSDAIWGYTQIGCYRNNGDPSTATKLSATAVYIKGHCWRPGPDSAGSTGTSGASTKDDVGPWDIGRDGPSRGLAKGTSVNLQAQYSMGFGTLSVQGAHDRYKSLQYFDPDYSNGYHYGQYGQSSLTNFFAGYDNDQTSQSLEVRLASNGNTRLKWLLGAYQFQQRANWNYGYLDNGQYLRYDKKGDTFDSDSQAVFANASYNLTDQLRVLGGIRSNKDSQKLTGGANGGGGNKPLWRLGAEYDVAKDMMLYATASTGYRVGGVNGATLVAAGAPAVYGPETVTALELGFKSQFMKRTLTLNGSLYSNRYRNMHAQSFVTACIDPSKPATCIASEFTSNGGEIDAKGAELEFNWIPGKSFFLNGSLAFLDAKFGNYLVSQLAGLGNLGGRQDVTKTSGQIVAAGGVPSLQLRGWQPALSPKFTASMQTGYVMRLGDGSLLTPMAQVSYSDKYWSFDYNVPGSEQKAYAKTDLRLRWKNEKKGITVEGFVENVTNQAVLVRSVVFKPDEANVPTASIQANYGDPRTWGIKVGMEF